MAGRWLEAGVDAPGSGRAARRSSLTGGSQSRVYRRLRAASVSGAVGEWGSPLPREGGGVGETITFFGGQV